MPHIKQIVALIPAIIAAAACIPESAFAQAGKPIQLEVKAIPPADPDPVCLGMPTLLRFRVCLFSTIDKNVERVPSNDMIDVHSLFIGDRVEDKMVVNRVTINGFPLARADLDGKKTAYGYTGKVAPLISAKGESRLLILTRVEQGQPVVPCFEVSAELIFDMPGQKIITMDAFARLKNVDAKQPNPLKSTDSIKLTVVPAPSINIKIDPVTPTGQNKAITLTPKSPINAIKNPAAIVILSEKGSVEENLDIRQTNTATIEITDVTPPGANLAGQIHWSIENVEAYTGRPDGDAQPRAVFFANRQTKIQAGATVEVFGVREGRIRIKAMHKADPQCSETYEALVVEQQTIPFRVQLLSGTKVKTNFDAEKARDHITIANQKLRQAGVRLKADDSTVKTDNAQTATIMGKAEKGYFKIEGLPDAIVGNVDAPTQESQTIRKNSRPRVLQLVYIDSTDNPDAVGRIVNLPSNRLDGIFRDLSITYSYRLTINELASEHFFQFAPFRFFEPFPGKLDLGTWGIVITNRLSNTAQLQYGNTIAHEVGHLLNLRHRGIRDEPANRGPHDFIQGQIEKNMMFGTDRGVQEDFDLVQCFLIRNSSIFPQSTVYFKKPQQ